MRSKAGAGRGGRRERVETDAPAAQAVGGAQDPGEDVRSKPGADRGGQRERAETDAPAAQAVGGASAPGEDVRSKPGAGRRDPLGMLGSWLIDDVEAQAVAAVMASQTLFRHHGPQLLHQVSAFEHAFAAELGCRHALGMSSGTAALRCALAALSTGAEWAKGAQGPEVIVPPCTFVATVNAVVLAGFVPVFAEIDETLGLCPERVVECIGPRTVGVVPVHLQGVAGRIDTLVDIARAHGLWVIEDCAQSFGAGHGGRATGTFGHFGAFSLQAHKTITCGEGGVLTSDDDALFGRARRFHDQGGERQADAYPSWAHPDAGFGENFKMGELQGAVARAQLTKLARIRAAMCHIHGRLTRELPLHGRTRRVDPSPADSLPHAFVLFAHDPDDRDRILAGLAARGVPADALYDEPIYRMAPFRRWARGEPVLGCPHPERRPRFEPCPQAEALMSRIVRLPLSPVDEAHDVDALIESVDAVLWEST